MANPWELDDEVGANPWDADEVIGNPLAKPEPRKTAWELGQAAQAGDPAAIEAYNLRARSLGQPTFEQEREQNSPVAGQNFAQNAWQSVGRYWPNIARNFDSPEEVDRARQIDEPLLQTGGGLAGSIASNVAMLAAPQSKLTAGLAATGKAAPYLSGATMGAVAGASEPVGSGESRIGNTGRAAIWGAGGQLAGDALALGGKAVASKVTPANMALWREAQKMGIELTPAQLADNRYLKVLSSQSKYWPGSGFAKSQAKQQTQFNRAVAKTMGESADVIDDPLMAQVKAKQAALYDKAFDGVEIKVDASALNGYNALKGSLEKRLSADQIRQFNAVADDFAKNIKGGKIEGKVYQELRKELKALEAQNPNGFGAAVRDLRRIVEGTAERSVPKANQDALKAADRLTRNTKVVEQARKRVANANDNIAPTSLWQPSNSKYGATPEMRALAKVGQQIKDPIADSGTAGRLENMNMLAMLYAGARAPFGQMANSTLASRYLVAQPKVIEGTSRTVGRALTRAGAPAYLARPKKDEKKKP